MGHSLRDPRSTSATGFNLSPPPPAGPLGSSPLSSSYGLASSFNGGLHLSGPPPPQSHSFFDTILSHQPSVVNAPQPTPSSANPIDNNSQIATMSLEIQRLQEENTIQKNTLLNYENKFSHVIQVDIFH